MEALKPVAQDQPVSQYVQHQQPLTHPKNLRVLVVDSKSSSRQSVCTLLRDCHYQVTAVKTSRDALELLNSNREAFDLVLKAHEPPAENACRLLRKMARSDLLATIPVVLMSSQDEREVVMKCLKLGAIDYLVKPLRHNELRHIWTRVWWWRRSGMGANTPLVQSMTLRSSMRSDSPSYQASSSDSKDTKCDDEEEPTSKEGSAPDANGNGHSNNGNGHGSNGNGSNGSKEGNGTSRVEAKPHGTGDGNGNGSSDNKDGNGNSATKNGQNGSNGNGASTTVAERNALVNTAEGKAPPNISADGQTAAKASRSFLQYAQPTSRKRPAGSQQGLDQQPSSCFHDESQLPPSSDQQGRSKVQSQRDRSMHIRSSAGATSTPSNHTASEDTIHLMGQHRANQHQHQHPPAGMVGFAPGSGAHDFPGIPPSPHTHFQSTNPGSLPAGLAPPWGLPHPHMQLPPPPQGLQAFPSLFAGPYGIPPQMLPPVHPLSLYSNPAGPPPPMPDGMPGYYAPQFAPDQMAAAAAAEAAAASMGQRLPDPSAVPPNYNPLLLNTFLQAYITQSNQQQQQVQMQMQQQLMPGSMPPLPPMPMHPGMPPPSNWRPPQFPPNPYLQLPGSNQQMQMPSQVQGPAGQDSSAGNHAAPSSSVPGDHRRTRLGSLSEPRRRRALALDKYRKKRKNLNFSKTIRYESRKQLAQQRPRIKGQFVKHANSKPGEGGDEAGNQGQSFEDEDFEEEEYEPDDEDMMDDDKGFDEQQVATDKADRAAAAAAQEASVQEEERDVVNSLRELRDGPRLFLPPKDALLAPIDGQATNMGSSGAAASNRPLLNYSSVGSQSGQNTARSNPHARALLSRTLAAQKQLQQAAEHGDLATGSNFAAHNESVNGNGNGKNGSDSGSNSPDDNGNGQSEKRHVPAVHIHRHDRK